MKSRILFVDDEQNVLEGLQRMLRHMRCEWDMAFVSSGQQALESLAEAPFDVLVTDMRMPGMDGPVLLTEVRERHPQIVRIVLSGYSAKGAMVRVAGLAHQYLAKPCQTDNLKNTITRSLGLRTLLGDESLTKLLAGAQSIPSLPRLYAQIIEELQRPNATARNAGEIIATDSGMTAKVLQLVNSAFFGIPQSVSSSAHAAVLLGIDTLQALVLGLGVFSEFTKTTVPGFEPEILWRHTTRTAAVAKRIAVAEGAKQEVADQALMGSILHDAGKLILSRNFPELYQEAMERARVNDVEQVDAERDVFGATHAEVAAYLLGLWGLPDPVVEAVAFHHCPGKASTDTFDPLTAVHMANALEHNHSIGQTGDTARRLDLDYLGNLGLLHRVPVWEELCRQALDDTVREPARRRRTP